MSPQSFARDEYRDLIIYTELARREANPEFRAVLEKLVQTEKQHFEFWSAQSVKQELHVNSSEIWLYLVMRRVLGLTFVARYLERGEKRAIASYTGFLSTVADEQTRICKV